MATMPIVFIGHGSPTNALEDNQNTQAWAKIADAIEKPKAILSISAHWCTNGTAVTAMDRPQTIHDFGRSLPAPLFDLQYPAPGDPALAARVKDLVSPTDAELDQSWGLDHGTWAVLLKAYPQADIPVVQLSMDATKPSAWHFEMGQRIAPLRDEGVLIMGTGNVVHNLSVMDWDVSSEPYDWADRFNTFVMECISNNEPEQLFDYQALGRDAEMSVPTPDHYWPLFYVLGARRASDRVSFAPQHVQHKSLSMLSMLFDHQSSP